MGFRNELRITGMIIGLGMMAGAYFVGVKGRLHFSDGVSEFTYSVHNPMLMKNTKPQSIPKQQTSLASHPIYKLQKPTPTNSILYPRLPCIHLDFNLNQNPTYLPPQPQPPNKPYLIRLPLQRPAHRDPIHPLLLSHLPIIQPLLPFLRRAPQLRRLSIPHHPHPLPRPDQ